MKRLALNALVISAMVAMWPTIAVGEPAASRTSDAVGTITEFPLGGVSPTGIAPGPDGNTWFVELNGHNVGRITPTGVITEYSVAPDVPQWIAPGPDGAMWLTAGNKIERITTSGVITKYTIPTASAFPIGITAGPDGNLWFTEYSGNKIGKITTAGQFTEYPVPGTTPMPVGITTGADVRHPRLQVPVCRWGPGCSARSSRATCGGAGVRAIRASMERRYHRIRSTNGFARQKGTVSSESSACWQPTSCIYTPTYRPISFLTIELLNSQ